MGEKTKLGITKYLSELSDDSCRLLLGSSFRLHCCSFHGSNGLHGSNYHGSGGSFHGNSFHGRSMDCTVVNGTVGDCTSTVGVCTVE